MLRCIPSKYLNQNIEISIMLNVFVQPCVGYNMLSFWSNMSFDVLIAIMPIENMV